VIVCFVLRAYVCACVRVYRRVCVSVCVCVYYQAMNYVFYSGNDIKEIVILCMMASVASETKLTHNTGNGEFFLIYLLFEIV
jgi:hypothetical protein